MHQKVPLRKEIGVPFKGAWLFDSQQLLEYCHTITSRIEALGQSPGSRLEQSSLHPFG